ncbi:MAG: flagellar export protein FliJ [Deltaproteobacteria bacterium]|nr:flagellar export protein FliJ [Deltaproteobacteria bacterium]
MKKFKFRLQQVLKYKTLIKKEHERELSAKHQELTEAEDRLGEIVEAQERNALSFEKPIRMAELDLKASYQKHLREALESQRNTIVEAIKAVETAREAYIEKAVEVKALEVVRKSRLEEHKKEVSHCEREDIEETVVQRYRFSRGDITNEEE